MEAAAEDLMCRAYASLLLEQKRNMKRQCQVTKYEDSMKQCEMKNEENNAPMLSRRRCRSAEPWLQDEQPIITPKSRQIADIFKQRKNEESVTPSCSKQNNVKLSAVKNYKGSRIPVPVANKVETPIRQTTDYMKQPGAKNMKETTTPTCSTPRYRVNVSQSAEVFKRKSLQTYDPKQSASNNVNENVTPDVESRCRVNISQSAEVVRPKLYFGDAKQSATKNLKESITPTSSKPRFRKNVSQQVAAECQSNRIADIAIGSTKKNNASKKIKSICKHIASIRIPFKVFKIQVRVKTENEDEIVSDVYSNV